MFESSTVCSAGAIVAATEAAKPFASGHLAAMISDLQSIDGSGPSTSSGQDSSGVPLFARGGAT